MNFVVSREGKRLQGRPAPAINNALVARTYRLKAEECRAVADSLLTDEARRSMLNVAQYYDRLAQKHERELPTLLDGDTSDET